MGTRRERILQKLNPNLLKITPKLSGDTGSVIDLDSEDSLEDGAKKLMMRFFRNQDLCEKNKRNSGQKETELTISTAKYNDKDELCEIVSHNVILPFGRDDDGSERPGKRLQDLKMELQEKMSAKWLEEYNKRVSENKSLTESKGYCKEKHSKKDEDSEGEDEDIEEEYDDANDADVEYEEDEDEVDKQNENEDEDESEVENEDEENEKDKDHDACSIGGDDDEQVPEDECKDKAEDIQEKDNEYYDEEGCSWVPAYQPGGGMLYGGSELTQSDEGLPQSLLSPSLRFTLSDSCKASQDNVEQTPRKSENNPTEEMFTSFREKVKLFSQNTNDSYDLNDAFELCSGKFPEAGEENEVNNEDEEEEEEDEEGCDDDKFESAIEEESDEDCQAEEVELEKKTKRKNIITFEDSEGEEDEKKDVEDEPKFDNEALRTSPLGDSKLLSDDEDDDEDPNSDIKTESKNSNNNKKKKKRTRKNLHFSDEEEEEEEEVGETNDDSEVEEEENEKEEAVDDGDDRRSIQYDSEENEITNPREFFEKEAELSGSEWSGDEDERGLDEFDVEEGDADNLDEDQVRSQLERIHVRRVLDDDAREVRLLQEILFEDGDLYTDGKVRERKFKWKNLGDFGDEKENEGGTKDGEGNSSEDEGAEEEEMRKLRHEKELFLMEKTAKKKDEDLSSDEEIVENFHTIKVTSVKTSIKQSGNGERKLDNSKVFTDYIEMAKTGKLSTVRGSFLSRNEEFLSRLAKATSGVTDSLLGPKNSKNFVFAPKSPEKVDLEKSTGCKRQVEESSCGGPEKKIKLLPRAIDTGPSILDLLV